MDLITFNVSSNFARSITTLFLIIVKSSQKLILLNESFTIAVETSSFHSPAKR